MKEELEPSFEIIQYNNVDWKLFQLNEIANVAKALQCNAAVEDEGGKQL
jgi:hypothetical protein